MMLSNAVYFFHAGCRYAECHYAECSGAREKVDDERERDRESLRNIYKVRLKKLAECLRILAAKLIPKRFSF